MDLSQSTILRWKKQEDSIIKNLIAVTKAFESREENQLNIQDDFGRRKSSWSCWRYSRRRNCFRACHRQKEQTIIHSRFLQKIIYVFTYYISVFYTIFIFASINHSFFLKCYEKGSRGKIFIRRKSVAKRGTTGV